MDNKLNQLKLEGLASDLAIVQKNEMIFKKIKSVWSDMKGWSELDQELFIHLKDNAINSTILHLGKLYDGDSKRNPTRSINGILNHLNVTGYSYKRTPIAPKRWEKFKATHVQLFNLFKKQMNTEPKEFLNELSALITREEKSENGITGLYILRKWRNKILTHNTKFEDNVELSDEQIEILINIPNSLLGFLNGYVQESNVVIIQLPNAKFIDHLIEKTVASNR